MRITAEEILRVREESGMGMVEVKKLLRSRDLRADVEAATTVDQLRDVLRELIDLTLPKHGV